MSNESTWFKRKCTPIYSCFGNCRWLAYTISAYEVYIICLKLKAAFEIHCKSPSRRLDGLTTLDWFTVHEATLSAYIRESAHVRNHVECGRVHQTLLLHVPQIFQRRKSDANKQDFEIKLNLTYQARSTPKMMGILTMVFYTSGPNLVILAWTGDELSQGQAQNGVNFDLKLNLTLKVNTITPQNNRDLNQGLLHIWSKFGDPSLNGWWVIARTSKWLMHTQTDTQTDRRRQRQYPKAKTVLG